jgi:hypothetical protein
MEGRLGGNVGGRAEGLDPPRGWRQFMSRSEVKHCLLHDYNVSQDPALIETDQIKEFAALRESSFIIGCNKS